MAKKGRGSPKTTAKRPRDNARIKTDLPFDEAVKHLLNAPPLRKESPPPQSEKAGEPRPE